MKKIKIILLPDVGRDVETSDWYQWLSQQLASLDLEVTATTMPDADVGRKKIWLPYIQNNLKADKNTIIVGHSLGGVAAMRYLETHPLFGLIAISVGHTNLGYPDRNQSSYFDSPWQWDKIDKNANWIVQFSSHDDPTIPIRESRFVHEQLNCEYHEFTGRGHFGSEYREEETFPELVEVIKRKLFIE